MRYEYYEIIAAELFGIKPMEIWLKSRKEEFCTPRMFCVKYRKENLRYSNNVAGKRYGLNHSTVNNARKTVAQFIETNDDSGHLYAEFLSKCAEQKKQLELNGFANKGEFIKRVESMGWYDYVKTVKEPLTELIELVFRNENEDNIREYLDVCEEKIGELKYLYQIENEPKL